MKLRIINNRIIPSIKNTLFSPIISANIPVMGKTIIIAIENSMLSTDIIVALCSEGISLFKELDCIG